MYTSQVEVHVFATVPGGGATSFNCAVPIQAIGQLHAITVTQESGTLAGFDVEVFDDARAAPPNTPAALSPAPAALTWDADHHRVCPKFTAANTAAVAQVFEPSAWVYRNTDVTVGNRVDADYLYFKITPATALTGKSFAISVRAAQPGA